MCIKILTTLLMATLYNTDTCVAIRHYNILTADGGGIRGLIPAQVIEHMEKYAFEYATNTSYIQKIM